MDGELDKCFDDAVGLEDMPHNVFAWLGEEGVVEPECVAVADGGVDCVVVDAGRGDGDADGGVVGADAVGNGCGEPYVEVSGFKDMDGVRCVVVGAVAEVPEIGVAFHGGKIVERGVGCHAAKVLELYLHMAIDGVDAAVGEVGMGEDVAHYDGFLKEAVAA